MHRPLAWLNSWAVAFVAVCVLATCNGCYYTYSARSSLERARAPYREFRQAALEGKAPFCGRYVGTGETNGSAYSCYEFTNILAGAGSRALLVLVCEGESSTNYITETRSPREGKSPAFVFTHYMGGNYSPTQYFHDYYPTEDPNAFVNCSIYLCAYGDSRHDLYLLRTNPASGELEWVKTKAWSQLEWQVRSRKGYFWGHLRYLYAVPLDVVTSPLQLFVALKLAY
jgi:hypothetical protein